MGVVVASVGSGFLLFFRCFEDSSVFLMCFGVFTRVFSVRPFRGNSRFSLLLCDHHGIGRAKTQREAKEARIPVPSLATIGTYVGLTSEVVG